MTHLSATFTLLAIPAATRSRSRMHCRPAGTLNKGVSAGDFEEAHQFFLAQRPAASARVGLLVRLRRPGHRVRREAGRDAPVAEGDKGVARAGGHALAAPV